MSDLHTCVVVVDDWHCPNPVRYRTSGLCSTHHGQKYRGDFTRIRPRKGHGSGRDRDDQGRKHCNRCDKWLPEGSFGLHPKTSDGLASGCNRCIRLSKIKRSFNLSEKEYLRYLELQGGRCAGCGDPPEVSDLSFRIDHDHACCPESGKSCGKCIRGLLCLTCNYALGVLKDDPQRLRALANYLEGANHE